MATQPAGSSLWERLESTALVKMALLAVGLLPLVTGGFYMFIRSLSASYWGVYGLTLDDLAIDQWSLVGQAGIVSVAVLGFGGAVAFFVAAGVSAIHRVLPSRMPWRRLLTSVFIAGLALGLLLKFYPSFSWTSILWWPVLFALSIFVACSPGVDDETPPSKVSQMSRLLFLGLLLLGLVVIGNNLHQAARLQASERLTFWTSGPTTSTTYREALANTVNDALLSNSTSYIQVHPADPAVDPAQLCASYSGGQELLLLGRTDSELILKRSRKLSVEARGTVEILVIPGDAYVVRTMAEGEGVEIPEAGTTERLESKACF